MSLSLVVSGLGAVLASVGSVMLARRSSAAPSTGLIAWTAGLAALAISLIAQAIGHAVGFGPMTFRGMELGAQVIAPFAISLGLAEIVARSGAVRFAARLLLPAIAFVLLVIFAIDPLNTGARFSKQWPDPATYYQLIPNKAIDYLVAPLTLVIALIAILVSAARQGRNANARRAFPPVAAAGLAALLLAVPGLAQFAADHLRLRLPMQSLFGLVCVLAAVLVWHAGVQLGKVRLDLMHRRAGDDETGEWGRDEAWDDDFAAEDGRWAAGERGERGERGYRGQRDWRGGEAAYDSMGGYGDRDDYGGGFRDALPGTGYREYSDDTDYGYARVVDGYDPHSMAGPADWRAAEQLAAGNSLATEAGASAEPVPGEGRDALFGQISIYTLLEGRTEEFDRLLRALVKSVRAREPDTLVYIVHAVPSAPLQRILYECYRNREAYEAHQRQPHTAAFEAERRSYVLATNVIELGLQQAKVSPLPSIANLFRDTSYDLLGGARPGHGDAGSDGTRRASERPDRQGPRSPVGSFGPDDGYDRYRRAPRESGYRYPAGPGGYRDEAGHGGNDLPRTMDGPARVRGPFEPAEPGGLPGRPDFRVPRTADGRQPWDSAFREGGPAARDAGGAQGMRRPAAGSGRPLPDGAGPADLPRPRYPERRRSP
jgi:quinol monooxygenase YgiN